MSITRLQQARQMYAMGQRVGFQGGGRDSGGIADSQGNVGSSFGGNGNARENYRSRQYTNLPTPTVTVGVDKFDNRFGGVFFNYYIILYY